MLPFIIEQLKKHRFWLFVALFPICCSGVYGVMQNYGIKIIVESLSKDIILKSDLFHALLFISGAEIMLMTIWRVSWFGYLRFMPNITNELINKYYDIIQGADHEFFKENSSHMIVSKLRGLSEKLREMFDIAVYKGVHNTSTAIISLTTVMFVQTQLTILVLIWFTIFVSYKIFMSKRVVALSFRYYQGYSTIFSLIGDKISNIKNIIQFSKGDHEKKKLSDFLSTSFTDKFRRKIKIETLDDVLSMFIYACFITIGIILVFKLKSEGKITIGEAVFAVTNIMLFAEAVWKVVFDLKDTVKLVSETVSSFTILQEAGLHKKRRESHLNKTKTISKCEIIFKDVTLKYGPKTIIDNLNFSIKPGEKIGITGRSGAGKTTLIKLLTKEIIPVQGQILIDNENINSFSELDLMSLISSISQDITFFNRSIFENIAYGIADLKESREAVYEAAKIANIHEEIMKMPHGYETIISQHNHRISTGQKQRIAIARAILKNSKILILDEATSNLDYSSEKLVQTGIDSLVHETNKTVIIIAHRLKTIKSVDRIILLENGKIEEEGSFEELMDKKGLFHNLCQYQ